MSISVTNHEQDIPKSNAIPFRPFLTHIASTATAACHSARKLVKVGSLLLVSILKAQTCPSDISILAFGAYSRPSVDSAYDYGSSAVTQPEICHLHAVRRSRPPHQQGNCPGDIYMIQEPGPDLGD